MASNHSKRSCRAWPPLGAARARRFNRFIERHSLQGVVGILCWKRLDREPPPETYPVFTPVEPSHPDFR